MKVYLVTAGCYSDYHIEGVFSSKETAEAYIAQAKGLIVDEPYIEEHEVDSFAPDPKGLFPFHVNLKENGDVIQVFRAAKNDFPLHWATWRAEGDQFYGTCMARHAEHAIKIVAEKRAESIARGELDDFKRGTGR